MGTYGGNGSQKSPGGREGGEGLHGGRIATGTVAKGRRNNWAMERVATGHKNSGTGPRGGQSTMGIGHMVARMKNSYENTSAGLRGGKIAMERPNPSRGKANDHGRKNDHENNREGEPTGEGALMGEGEPVGEQGTGATGECDGW